MVSHIGDHISHQYDQELQAIQGEVMSLGGLIEQVLGDALAGLVSFDYQKAEGVVSRISDIRELESSIYLSCTDILARRQPAASDLRFVLAVIKAIDELEGIGEEAGRIAKMSMDLIGTSGKHGHGSNMFEIELLGGQVLKMLRDALNTFARMDSSAALEVASQAAKIIQQHEGVVRQSMTYMMEDPRSIPRVLDIISSARALERISERTRGICVYVVYFVNRIEIRDARELVDQWVQR